MPSLDPTASLVVRVQSIRYGTHDTNVYELRPVGAHRLPPSRPGAHIALHLPDGCVRQYSLLEPQEVPASYFIGVKCDPASRGGSRYIHEQLRVGQTLPMDLPRNNFALREDAPHTLLLAGGIGITPLLCMWRRLQALGRGVELVYSCRSRRDALFLDLLEGQPGVRLRFDDEHAGTFLDIAALVAGVPCDTHVYCCGPAPMLKAFTAATSAWPTAQVHLESFAPLQEASLAGGFLLKLARSGRTVSVTAGQSVLDALRASGVDAASSCEEGICGACEVRVLAGIPDHRDSVLSPDEQQANDRMMICCSGSKTPELVLDL
jgi:tetrachlorobenzoquinone reductase